MVVGDRKMNNINRSLGILGNISHNHIGVLMSRNVQVRIILTIAAAFSIVVTYQSGLLTDADALTRYYNCTTRAANKNGTLSLQNVDNCYDNVFKGAKAAEKEMQMLEIETTK